MNVEQILAAKGDDVISIEPTARPLSTAARLLSTHRIGAVVIVGAGGRLVRDSCRSAISCAPLPNTAPMRWRCRSVRR